MAQPSTTKPSPCPALDAFKAKLAALSPEQRRKVFAELAEVVRKRLTAPQR